MPFYIEICHPNEIQNDAWIIVDEIQEIDEFREHLQSPNFTLYDGLLVRIKNYCIYACKGDQFVQITLHAEIWTEEKSAGVLASTFHKYISRTTLMSFIGRRILDAIQYIEPWYKNPIYDDAMASAFSFLHAGDMSSIFAYNVMVAGIRNNLINEDREIRSVPLLVQLFIEELINDKNNQQNILTNIAVVLAYQNHDDDVDGIQETMADQMREEIPFMEIVLALTNPSRIPPQSTEQTPPV